LSCFRLYWEVHVWSMIHMDNGSCCLVFACIEKCMYEVWFTWIKNRLVLFWQHDPLSMWITLHTWTSQYKRKQDNTILYPCESHFIHGLLNTSENKTTRSFIHVNHTSYVDLVFACIEKSTYEVWFTWIKDRVVLFSLVLRSPRMKCDSHG
jgi:hypothetical protein